jgi:polysaccharide pyruvyl transferase WcaK-like protein
MNFILIKSMIGFLKWYYGYKNFGDELLLLGIIPYIFKHYQIDSLLIEAKDTVWLETRLHRHQWLLGVHFHKITVIAKHSAWKQKRDVLFLWWWEVLTDGRSFPHNWRNYLLYRKTILFGKYNLLWGIGTPQSFFSKILRKVLLSRAQSVVTREKRSYDVVTTFRKQETVLYHDFAKDVINPLLSSISVANNTAKHRKWVVNVNPYIWSSETKQRLIQYWKQFDYVLFFPAELWVDDTYYNELKVALPDLMLYDRTKNDIQTILYDVSTRSGVLAARLHVLRLAKLLNIPFEALVYQEKIKTFLGE